MIEWRRKEDAMSRKMDPGDFDNFPKVRIPVALFAQEACTLTHEEFRFLAIATMVIEAFNEDAQQKEEKPIFLNLNYIASAGGWESGEDIERIHNALVEKGWIYETADDSGGKVFAFRIPGYSPIKGGGEPIWNEWASGAGKRLKFLAKKEDTRLWNKKLTALLKEKLKDLPEAEKKELTKLQRIYRIAPSPDALDKLIQPAIDSLRSAADNLIKITREAPSIWYDREVPEVVYRIWRAMEKSKERPYLKTKKSAKGRTKKRGRSVFKNS
jgi:hypothetical protein